MRTGPTPDTRRRRPRADRWRRRGGGRRATLTPRGGREGGRARAEREAGPRGSEGERHRPEPPPPHRDAHTGSTQRPGAHLGTPAAFPRRTPSQRTAGPDGPPADAPSADRPHGPAWATATKPLSSTPRGATFPPHTPPRDQARRAAAAAAAGTPFKPQLPPARRAAPSPRHPATAPGPVHARLPPREEGPGSTAAGRPDEERERQDRRRGGEVGANRQNEDRRRQGRPQRQPPAGDASQGTGRPLGRRPGTRAKPAGITLHPTRSSPATPAAPSRPETNGHPREPEETPTDARENRGRRRRQPTKIPAWQRVPNVRRRAGRGRPPVPPNKKSAPESEAKPRGSRTLESPAEGEGGVGGIPRSPPAVGTLPWKGGTRRQPQTPESTRHAPHATRPRRESGRDVGARRRDAHATEGTGETGRRVGPGAHRRPSKPTRPATTPRGEGGTAHAGVCTALPRHLPPETQSPPQAPHSGRSTEPGPA